MKTQSILAAVVILILGIFLNLRLIKTTQVQKVEKEKYAQILNFKERFFDKDEWLSTDKTNPKLRRAKRQQSKIAEIQVRINRQKTIASSFYGACIVGLLVAYVMGMGIANIIFLLSIVALVCLHAGIFIPMLEIAAFEHNLDLGEIPIQTKIMGMSVDFTFEKQFDGDMYFYYQSKSIKELIVLLLSQKNYVVGLSILVFSIIFPLIKTLLTILVSFKTDLVNQNWYQKFVLHLGKWSMADVFVVAIFLGFLAFQNMQVGINTQSNILLGLYFFFAYCMLSIIASMLSYRLVEERI